MDIYATTDQAPEHVVDQSLVSGPCIFEAEGHYPITVGSLIGKERGLLFVTRVYVYLIVPRVGIHKRQERMSYCHIHQEINSGQWIAILGAGLIKVSEVYAQSPLLVAFPNQYNVGQLVRILDFAD